MHRPQKEFLLFIFVLRLILQIAQSLLIDKARLENGTFCPNRKHQLRSDSVPWQELHARAALPPCGCSCVLHVTTGQRFAFGISFESKQLLFLSRHVKNNAPSWSGEAEGDSCQGVILGRSGNLAAVPALALMAEETKVTLFLAVSE